MYLCDVEEEARAFLLGFTGRVSPLASTRELAARLLALPGRRPKWHTVPLAPPLGTLYAKATQAVLSARVASPGVSLQVLAPEVLEARGDLVSCAVLLAVTRYNATPRGRCPERLRALASVVLVEGHAILTSPKVP
jgi:hypothetical protein